jgi:hypothetical protein
MKSPKNLREDSEETEAEIAPKGAALPPEGRQFPSPSSCFEDRPLSVRCAGLVPGGSGCGVQKVDHAV